jgi:DNA repair exonuclease SbcCD ATPase subunit
VRWLSALVVVAVGLVPGACGGASDVEDQLGVLKERIADAATSANQAIDAAKGEVEGAVQTALNQASQAATQAESAIEGSGGADLSGASREALDEAESQLEDARAAIEKEAGQAGGAATANETLDKARAEIDSLIDRIKTALAE